MNPKHLSDEVIQLFASGENISPENQQHLLECAYCREQLEGYELLIEAIVEEPAPSLQFDLSTAVLNQLAPIAAPAPKSRDLVIPVAALVVPGGLIYAFRDQLDLIFNGINLMTILLIIVSTVTILGFISIEMFNNYRKKMQALDFYS